MHLTYPNADDGLKLNNLTYILQQYSKIVKWLLFLKLLAMARIMVSVSRTEGSLQDEYYSHQYLIRFLDICSG